MTYRFAFLHYSVGFQALIQYQSRQSATSAMSALHVRYLWMIYEYSINYLHVFLILWFCGFAGTEYIWWLLSARCTILKVKFHPSYPHKIWLLNTHYLKICLRYNLIYIVSICCSLTELQVNFNNDRSRFVQLILETFHSWDLWFIKINI